MLSKASSQFMENLVYGVKMKARIISYAPSLMKAIREIDGISEDDLIKSIDPKNNREQIFKMNQQSETNDGGRSGSFFFFSQDKRFIVKTMTQNEKKILLGML